MYLTGESASRLLKTVLTTSAFLTLVLTGCSNNDLERTNEELQAQVDALTQRLDEVMSTDPQSLIDSLSEADRSLFDFWRAERGQLENLRGVLKDLENRVAASQEFEYLIPTIAEALRSVSTSSQVVGEIPEVVTLGRSWDQVMKGLAEYNNGDPGPPSERQACLSWDLEQQLENALQGGSNAIPPRDCAFPIQRFGFRELMRDANSFGVWLDTISRKFEPLVR